ncbi:YqcC family protein [Kluyvera cryocrescens]|uniref:YqcC family protein n=1 Tax=Kluyvera cryocrescens TaxID=580 RepID=UPI002DB6E1DA|nr:YqcC family protein [Kluyvera cryocrescens]MEB7713743.1 YqcC family protein [Kluyvera cryocrescens]
MTRHDSLRDQLLLIETLLRQHRHWQDTAPHDSAFASDQPFCMDTLQPLEWLQWVLIPRMHQLLDSGMPLPKDFAITPYYEMALDAAHPLREIILPPLSELDAFFADDAR